MKIVTVATHEERYFTSLKDSCIKHNCDLVVLEWGQKWRGFGYRYQCMRNYLESVDDNEIIVFIDAFDVVILRDAKDIESNFRALKVPMLFSVEKPYANLFFRYTYTRVYKYFFQGFGLCAGLYMGYAGSMKKFLDIMVSKLTSPKLDDQILLMELTQLHPEIFNVDKQSIIFHNIHGGSFWRPFYTYFDINNNQYCRIKEKKLVTIEGISPCILHGPGMVDMDEVISQLGYSKPLPDKRQKEKWKYMFRGFIYYLPYFKIELFIILIFICYLLL